MTKREASEFKERWRLVNSFIADEIRNTTPQIKLQQLRVLFNSNRLFRSAETKKQVDVVRARWNRLKEKAHG